MVSSTHMYIIQEILTKQLRLIFQLNNVDLSSAYNKIDKERCLHYFSQAQISNIYYQKKSRNKNLIKIEHEIVHPEHFIDHFSFH